MTDPTPEAYEAAARAQLEAFGPYHPPLTGDELAMAVTERAGRPYVRATVDAVWDMAQQSLRQHMFAAALDTTPREDEMPVLMSRFQRELRDKIAREIREYADKQATDLPWHPERDRFAHHIGGLRRAARIAEGSTDT